MNRHWQQLITAFLFSLVAVSAQAGILELRVGAGLSSSNADDFEDQVNTVGDNGLSADEFETFNADIFFNLPVSPIGIGLRQEWLNLSDDSNGDSLDVDVSNTSLLVDLRLIDTAFYLGPIVAIGYPTADLDFDSGAASFEDQVDGDRLSYSAGLEAGAILGHFIIGAEAGYQSIELESSDNSSGVNADIDVSGFYGKAMVGLTFL